MKEEIEKILKEVYFHKGVSDEFFDLASDKIVECLESPDGYFLNVLAMFASRYSTHDMPESFMECRYYIRSRGILRDVLADLKEETE